MQISIAPTHFNRWHELLALLQRSFADMDARIDPPSSLKHMTAEDLQAKALKETLIVVQDGEDLIGCAFVDVRSDCVYVGKVAVDARFRGRGIARQIMEAAESIACASGRSALELQTRVELVENHRTFAALGFSKVAETAHAGYSRPTSITMRRAAGRASGSDDAAASRVFTAAAGRPKQ